MPLTRNPQPDSSISVMDLKDGQIAEITAWPKTYMVGDIVQRSGPALIYLGGQNEIVWASMFGKSTAPRDGRVYRVRILPDGDTLTVAGNQ